MIFTFAYVHLQTSAVDPALVLAQKLCGGHWKYKGPKIEVDLVFKSEQNGSLVLGTGTIKAETVILTSHSQFGWDPKVKKTYYLDSHQNDTVYFGHVSMDGEIWTNDFTTLVGTSGHWIQRAKLVDANTLDSSLFAITKDGTERLEEHFVFKRK